MEISASPDGAGVGRIAHRTGSPGLAQAGVLLPSDDVVMSDVKDLHYAYVLSDRYRNRAVKELPGRTGPARHFVDRKVWAVGAYVDGGRDCPGQRVAAHLRMKAAA